MQKVLCSEEEEVEEEVAVVELFLVEPEEAGEWLTFFFSYLRTSSERHRSPLGRSRVGKPDSLKVSDFLKASMSVLAMQRSKTGREADEDEEVVVVFVEEE